MERHTEPRLCGSFCSAIRETPSTTCESDTLDLGCVQTAAPSYHNRRLQNQGRYSLFRKDVAVILCAPGTETNGRKSECCESPRDCSHCFSPESAVRTKTRRCCCGTRPSAPRTSPSYMPEICGSFRAPVELQSG